MKETETGPCILVIDDDPDVVTYLTTFFEDHGFRSLAADLAGARLETDQGLTAGLQGHRPTGTARGDRQLPTGALRVDSVALACRTVINPR